MAATLSPTSPSALQQGGVFQARTTEFKGSFAVKFPRAQDSSVGSPRTNPAPARVMHPPAVEGSGTPNLGSFGEQRTARLVAHCLCVKKVMQCVLALAILLPKAHSPQSYSSPSYERLGKNIGLNFYLHSWEKRKMFNERLGAVMFQKAERSKSENSYSVRLSVLLPENKLPEVLLYRAINVQGDYSR